MFSFKEKVKLEGRTVGRPGVARVKATPVRTGDHLKNQDPRENEARHVP